MVTLINDHEYEISFFHFIFWFSLPALHSLPQYRKGGNGDDDCDDVMAMVDDDEAPECGIQGTCQIF